MHCRAVLPLLALLLASCGGRALPEPVPESVTGRLPQEIDGFRRLPPEGTPGTLLARYAHPNGSALSIHALAPSSRAGGEEAEVGVAMEVVARAVAVDAASRRENVALRHFAVRAAEAGPVARCLDAQLRGEIPRRQIACATLLERRVFLAMMLAPEAADMRRGLRDPLLGVTMRVIGALAGNPPEPVPAAAEAPLPPPPVAAPPAPPPPTPRRPRLPGSGPTWRT